MINLDHFETIENRTFNFRNPLQAQEKFMHLMPLASYKDSLPHSTFSTPEFFLLYYWVARCNQKNPL